jgi:hypothetical protein
MKIPQVKTSFRAVAAVYAPSILILCAAGIGWRPSWVRPTSNQPHWLTEYGCFSQMRGLITGGDDIASLNALCASNLSGALDMDPKAVLHKLDTWARSVKVETARHLYRAHDPRWAERYRNSESYLKVELLLQVLQEDCGVHYNRARINDPDFRNSKDLFIHGLVGSDNGGTCVSMPVLYVAIGRRLGYPVYLVLAKRHVFCRWDDGKGERFNFDGAGEGIAFHPDEFYRTWPAPISDDEVARGEYLKNLTPAEELAVFLATRGHVLYDTGRFAEAHQAYAAALNLMPQSREVRQFLAIADEHVPTSSAEIR